MGVNGINALSVYNTSKWMTFGRKLREEFKAQFPQDMIEKTFTAWFLHIPANDGFTDEIATWESKPCGNMHYYSVALRDGQTIIIDGETHTFDTGDVCWFNIKSRYQIPHSSKEQMWACLLVADY